jgi:hypothetical protein
VPLKYRDNMTTDELNALLAEAHQMEVCYAESEAWHAERATPPEDDEECECFDPIRDGWVDRNTGRP